MRRYHTGGVTSPTASAASVMRDALNSTVDNKADCNGDDLDVDDINEEELISVEDASVDNLQLDQRFLLHSR